VPVGAGNSATVRIRLTDTERAGPDPAAGPFADFDAVLDARRNETDEFLGRPAHR
jgi:hypothetical protein